MSDKIEWSTPAKQSEVDIAALKKLLLEKFPTARPGLVSVLVDALDIHARKNHDYNGKLAEKDPSTFELHGKFFDIRRKYNRLLNAIEGNGVTMVNENLEDTALDLGVYAFLMAEYIGRAMIDEEK